MRGGKGGRGIKKKVGQSSNICQLQQQIKDWICKKLKAYKIGTLVVTIL
jgi:hypothetical protein